MFKATVVPVYLFRSTSNCSLYKPDLFPRAVKKHTYLQITVTYSVPETTVVNIFPAICMSNHVE